MHDERGESTTINLNASMKASVEATGSLQVSTASPRRLRAQPSRRPSHRPSSIRRPIWPTTNPRRKPSLPSAVPLRCRSPCSWVCGDITLIPMNLDLASAAQEPTTVWAFFFSNVQFDGQDGKERARHRGALMKLAICRREKLSRWRRTLLL
jgi:hypothetical protein